MEIIAVLKTLWRFKSEIAIAVIATVIIAFGFYFKHVLNDRASLGLELAKIKAEVEAIKKQATLNEDIADAIKKIKIQSNNYVSVVETATRPPSNKSVLFIASGVPKSFGVYSSNTARSSVSIDATSDAGSTK